MSRTSIWEIAPKGYIICGENQIIPFGYFYNLNCLAIAPIGCNIELVMNMNRIAEYVKENRKAAGLTQEEFALRSGLGLRFVRELEQEGYRPYG